MSEKPEKPQKAADSPDYRATMFLPATDFPMKAGLPEAEPKWLNVQREQIQRLGQIGDFEHPYTTMNFKAEAAIAREAMKFVENGLLYRGFRPVMWSPVEKTALADAEVEYHEKTSPTIYVKFPLVKSSPELAHTFIVIWTTT